VHEVIGTGGADADEPLGVDRRDELERAWRPVDAQHLGPLAGHRAADRRQQVAQHAGVGRLAKAPREARDVPGARVDEAGGAVDGVDRAAVRLLRAVAPDDQAVLGKHDEPQLWVRAHRLADLLGQREAGADVRDPRRGRAEARVHEPLAVGRAREHADRVRMRVVHVRRGHERVQQRLDRRPRHRGIELAAREVGDHLLVGHGVTLQQRQHLAEPQAGDMLRTHRREVGARALHPHRRDLAAGVVDRRPLRGRVAAAEVRDRAIGAQQVRRQQELADRVVRHGAGRPAVGNLIDDLRDGAHRVSSCSGCRPRAVRST
jgi:hypothetical protein